MLAKFYNLAKRLSKSFAQLCPAKLQKVLHIDKILHMFFGAIIALAFCFIGLPISGVFAAIFVGCCKEIADEISGLGTFDLADAAYTVIGGCVIVAFWFFCKSFK